MFRRISNPPNPFHSSAVEWLDIPPPKGPLEIYEEEVKSIISKNQSPDVGFNYSVNPYRGCFHACAYCYARPTHQYLDFGAGTDFETKIVVKVNAAQKLKSSFLKPSWAGECIAFSGVTDCYQPIEASYALTRSCLEVCAEFRNPIAIITKGVLVRRDIDVLQDLCKNARAKVIVSLAFDDDKLAQTIEPQTPRPSTRLRAISALATAGIPVGVALAPVIPGLNDHMIPAILERAKEQGASSAFMTLLRLPAEVKDVFKSHIREVLPTQEAKILGGIRKLSQGSLNRNGFGSRMKGEGPRWQAIEALFRNTCEKLGLNTKQELSTAMAFENLHKHSTFRRPRAQLNLFE